VASQNSQTPFSFLTNISAQYRIAMYPTDRWWCGILLWNHWRLTPDLLRAAKVMLWRTLRSASTILAGHVDQLRANIREFE